MDGRYLFFFLFPMLLYLVWLVLLCFLVGRFMVRDGPPLRRAALCVLVGVAITWAGSLGIEAVTGPRTVIVPILWERWPYHLAQQLTVPLLAFLWEYWRFRRHWVEQPDLGKIFE